MTGGTAEETLLPLVEPSLGEVRARLVQKRLSGRARGQGRQNGQARLPQLVATGRTGSGKSTLGNLLVGYGDLLRSTGRQDCTQAAHVLRFPRGLTYVDLPGVASSDRLENFNRVALGLSQVPDWPSVTGLQVLEYDGQRCTGDRTLPVGQISADLLRPDLVLYLIAPHLGLGRAEKAYLKDLLRSVGPDRMVFVLNLFHGAGGRRIATAQNLADVRDNLVRWHQEAGLRLDTSRLVPMDCRSGAGLAELLSAARDRLGGSTALTDVINYQNERAPAIHRARVQEAVVGFAAQLAPKAAESDETAAALPTAAARLLAGYAGRLAKGDGCEGTTEASDTSDACAEEWFARFEALVAKEIAKLRVAATEPIIKRKSKDIYEKVPRYDYVKVPDRSRPIYETRRRKVTYAPGDIDEVFEGVGNWWNGKGFVTERYVSEQVIVGYKKKKRKVAVGYDDRYVRTDHWDEAVGERELSVTYTPFGTRGIALALTAWYASLHALSQGDVKKLNAVRRGVHHRVKDIGTDAERLVALAGGLFPEDADGLLEAVLRNGETGGAP